MLKTAKVANTVNIVPDGVAAMEYVRRQGEYATAHRPDLILLNLNCHARMVVKS